MSLRRRDEIGQSDPNDVSLPGEKQRFVAVDLTKSSRQGSESGLSGEGRKRELEVEREEDSNVVDEIEVEFDDADEAVSLDGHRGGLDVFQPFLRRAGGRHR